MLKFPLKYYKFCFLESLDFQYRLWRLSKIKSLTEAIPFTMRLMEHATIYGNGYYASSELEKPFLELAEQIGTPKGITYKPHSFLHVITTAYCVGGHTRVAERWIASSPMDEIHSVVLLSQNKEPIPERLRTVVADHHGELIIFDNTDIETRATQLRKTALEYEYIILHVHMDDATPIVAFGKDDFPRPVILFNHADHSYWCGSSVVDMVADLRDNDMYKVRGISNHYTLGIPIEISNKRETFKRTKLESRKRLGLPADKKIILTIGAPVKYSQFAQYEFCDILKECIGERNDTICVGVGPTSSTGHWMKYPDVFYPVGSVEYGDDFFDYINACDVYVGSIPIDGGLAMLDAIQYRKPVLTYSVFETKLGDLISGIKSIVKESEFRQLLNQMLDSEEDRNAYAEKQFKDVLQYHNIEAWRYRLMEMIIKTPSAHRVNRNYIRGKRSLDEKSIYISVWNRTMDENRRITIHDLYHQMQCLFNR